MRYSKVSCLVGHMLLPSRLEHDEYITYSERHFSCIHEGLAPYCPLQCSLIINAEMSDTISGTSICRGAPSVSHLLFADDCFLFFKAEESQAHVMKNILNVYEVSSGQAISLPKSEIFYSRNMADDLKNNITKILAVRDVLGTRKYLAMPSMLGRDRTTTYAYIKDRV